MVAIRSAFFPPRPAFPSPPRRRAVVSGSCQVVRCVSAVARKGAKARSGGDRDDPQTEPPLDLDEMKSGAEGVPAFLAKLWKLVEDTRTDHLIAWYEPDNSFVIKDQNDFARKLLPLYYKHNNMASFIRQLNMYGFHKVVSVDTGSLRCDNEEVRFSHPCFLQGHPYLLKHIKRKISTAKGVNEEKALLKPEFMTKMLTDVKHMKGRQESLDARFSIMKHENEALWREVAVLRQKHSKQQQIVNNLIQFLMSLVQNSRSGPLKTGMKRGYQLMINSAAHDSRREYGARAEKSPRVDSDGDLDADDTEDMLNDLEAEACGGPVIHEVREHDHSAGSPSSTARRRESTMMTSPTYVSSPAVSLPESLDAAFNDIDDGSVPSLLFDLSCLDNGDSQITAEIKNSDNSESKSMTAKKDKKTVKGKSTQDSYRMTPSPAFTITSTQPPATLPINIFDDEANSQDNSEISLTDVNRQAALSAYRQDENVSTDVPEAESMDNGKTSRGAKINMKSKKNASKSNDTLSQELLDNIAAGSYNSSIDLSASNSGSKTKNKSNSKKKNDTMPVNIKEENTFDDIDNMTMAMLPSENKRPVLNRFHSVEDVDDHLLSMQTDIENLKELLCGDSYSFDANTLLGLFGQEEPLYGLSLPSQTEASLGKTKDDVDESNQLISYVPPNSNLGFDDFSFDDELTAQPTEDAPTESASDETLNTPQVQLLEPKFPNDNNF